MRKVHREHWLALLNSSNQRTGLEALIYLTERSERRTAPLPESCGGAPGVRLPRDLPEQDN